MIDTSEPKPATRDCAIYESRNRTGSVVKLHSILVSTSSALILFVMCLIVVLYFYQCSSETCRTCPVFEDATLSWLLYGYTHVPIRKSAPDTCMFGTGTTVRSNCWL